MRISDWSSDVCSSDLFVESRELARRQQHEGYEKYTAERDRLQSRQQTQREWAVTGVKNAKKKKTDNDKFIPHLKSQRSEKMAAKVKATEKAIERLDVVDKPWEPWQLQLELKATSRAGDVVGRLDGRSEEHTSELQSLLRISYAVFCLKTKKTKI